jgi:hypothetical protein
MKTRIYLVILSLLACSLLLGQVYAKNDKGRDKPGQDDEDRIELKNKGEGSTQKYAYQYKGKYKNFEGNNHYKRFYFRGKYYPFNDYYNLYYQESNAYTFEGRYPRHNDVFIFSDRYGNEFDLYVEPVEKLPAIFTGYSLKPGHTYEVKIRSVKMYPSPDEVRAKLTLSFDWGVLQLEKGGYFDLHSSPQLINCKGKLYIK